MSHRFTPDGPPAEGDGPHRLAGRALLALLLTLPAGLFFWLATLYPKVGSDYAYFLSRLLDTHGFMSLNPGSVHWWTATFGGGLPVFANPQSMQYSLPQWLMLLLPPYPAVITAASLCILLGSLGAYRLGRGPLGLSAWQAAGVALSFSLNGFVLSHLLVGHLGYHAFPLLSCVLLLLVDRRIPILWAGIGLGCLGSYFVYSGGHFIILLALVSLLVCLPLLVVLGGRLPGWSALLGRSLLGAGLATMLSAAKLFAVFAFLAQFPRVLAGETMPGFLSPLLQLFLLPVWMGVGAPGRSPHHDWFNTRHGLWEVDLTLNPLLLVVLALALVLWGGAGYRRTLAGWTPGRLLAALATGAAVLLVLAVASGQGVVYDWLRAYPPFKFVHVNARFTAALLLPLALLGGWGLGWLMGRTQSRRRRGLALAGVYLGALSVGGLYGWLIKTDPAALVLRVDPTRAAAYHGHLQRGGEPPAIRYISARHWGEDSLYGGYSSRYPHEPLFGYNLETFAATIAPGAVLQARDGYWNLHFPPALVYPDYYRQAPFTRVVQPDRENLERLLSHRPPDWALPTAQRLANGITLAGLALLLVLCGVGLWPRVWRRGGA